MSNYGEPVSPCDEEGQSGERLFIEKGLSKDTYICVAKGANPNRLVAGKILYLPWHLEIWL
jgi:hypothetical protein